MSDMVKKEISDLINKSFKKQYVSTSTLDILPLLNSHNIFGNLYSVKVESTNIKNKQTLLNVIVKLAPKEKQYRNNVFIRCLYENEICMYNNIIPEFVNFQQEKNIEPLFQPFAKIYGSSLEEFGESLVLEDLVKQGYSLGSYKEPVKYSVAIFVMEELGKLHALSYAIRDQKPTVFNKLKNQCSMSYFLRPEIFNNILGITKNLSEQLINTFSTEHAFALATLKESITNASELFSDILKVSFEEYGVLNHGDHQLRNLFFQYEDLHFEKPTKLCIIDWQLAHFTSPAWDLLYFIYISTDKNFRDHYYKDLLQTYYNSLSNYTNKLGADVNKIIPFEILLSDLKTLAPFILYAILPLISQNSQDLESLRFNIAYEKDTVKMFTPSINSACILRIQETILDYIKHGYL
ncbi:hypothetical protein RN001_000471 [Aquatica leii]|uniref:CHK kinase-like domain-containing protein n=1 Tax=Aquatica leii TaxID=1421715 RepID=A0AAN7PA04_9COLE|nr:hypothetical protein RN001_000471 [Aquatica leii]